MSKNGKIKRKDIISDAALHYPKKYAKSIKKAIKANKKFQKAMLKIKEQYFVTPSGKFFHVKNN